MAVVAGADGASGERGGAAEDLPEHALATGAQVALLVLVVLLASAQVLSFPRTPESWSQLALLRERSVLGALAPFPEYPYYRPLWFLWLSVADRLGLGGGAAHIAPLALHCGGVLLVYGALRRCAPRLAFAGALLAGCAPGLAGALSWLAAGNKCFVFFWLALGVWALVRVASARAAFGLAFFASALPAIASSENGYMSCVLLPFVALVARPRGSESAGARFAGATLLGALAAGASALHLFVLSPQRATSGDNRVAELVKAWGADPAGSALAFADNCGRFFLHGVGVADDAPRAGALVLAVLAVALLALRRRAALVALAVFVVLNVPASVFPGESSRHHAYLPALGAGLVSASLLCALPWRAYLLPLVAIFFLSRGFEQQRPWRDYCAHSARVYASCAEAMPRLPAAKPVLWNVPMEYRAAFLLQLGRDAEVDAWTDVTALSSRTQVVLPAGWEPPAEGPNAPPVLEYDGTRVVATSITAIAARVRAPRAWWEREIRAYERPWLAWGENLANKGRLVGAARGFTAARQVSDASEEDLAGRPLAVDAHAFLEGRPGVYWECTIGQGPAAWLVLPWTPWSAMRSTENAWLFTLAPLPWLFEVEVFELGEDGERTRCALPSHAAYGFVPALWCDGAARRLRVELRLRGS